LFAERCVHFEWVPCEAGERNVGEIMGGETLKAALVGLEQHVEPVNQKEFYGFMMFCMHHM